MERAHAPDQARVPALLFSSLVAVSFILIVLGALVRAHNAGLSCPDWPLCFGQLVPMFDFRIALEFGHRVLAACVSIGLLGGSLLVLRNPQLRAVVRRPLALAWLLLSGQVVLGGLTVLLGLAPWTVTAHLLVGNAFCATLLWTTLALRAAAQPPAPATGAVSPFVARLACVCAILVGVQVALGGLVASHYAGLACASFPTCDGASVAPTFSGPVGLHVIHRFNALGLLAAVGGLVVVTRRAGRVGRLARHALLLLLLQVGVGASNVLLELPVEVTALHSALSAAIVLVLLALLRAALRPHTSSERAAGNARVTHDPIEALS